MRETRHSSRPSETRVLVDAGLSRREIAKRLAAIGEDIDYLDAVLVTHEHCDHVSAAGCLVESARRHDSRLSDARHCALHRLGRVRLRVEVLQAGLLIHRRGFRRHELHHSA